jgi:hypothetical protein
MNKAFYWCVDVLKYYANLLGITYEEINIWIFCIIEPIVFFIMLGIIINYYFKIKELKRKI